MHPRCLTIPPRLRDELEFLFLAKHALGDGKPHAEDGTHATYHHELLSTLRGLGLNVRAADSFQALFEPEPCDFLVTLYNRAGFRNSEMLAPLLAEMHRIPYLGGAPMVRGLADDKHFMKRIAHGLGITTPAWKYYPIGGLDRTAPTFAAERLIVKPNASSASWGILIVASWQEAWEHVEALHAQGHDVIVEAFVDGDDLAVPIVGSITPWFLPTIRYGGTQGQVRTYEEKRDLVANSTQHEAVTDIALLSRVQFASQTLVAEIWPFDHGRLEFRLDTRTGEVHFIEININCNLWSRKTISSVARQIGVSHPALIETILCHSLMRQGVTPRRARVAA